MSRIFEALQRSGTEQSGVEYPDVVSMATAVFEAPRVPEFEQTPVLQPTEEIRIDPLPAAIVRESAPQAVSPTAFPSLEMSIGPTQRLVFFTQPESLAAEKFRFLGVRLRQMRQNRPLKKVLITSTIPEEGKSFIASNLAGALAQRKEKERVLLIDGDLRRPVLAEQFGLGRLAGLSEWLESGVDTTPNIYRLNGPGFWIMPGGVPPANPLELMQSGKLSALINQLATLFDWIIVDSPPLLPLADSTIWSRLTDGMLLVTREGKTEKAALQRGLEMIKKSNLLGVVLNSCTDQDQEHYYRRYSPATK